MGKGSGRRPAAISDGAVAHRWQETFGPVCSYCGGRACEHQAATERWLDGGEAYPGVDTGDQGPQIADASRVTPGNSVQ